MFKSNNVGIFFDKCQTKHNNYYVKNCEEKQRILMTIEYDGTNFCGWQTQNQKRTVQGEIESALSSFYGEDIQIHGSGRTDAGVHALGQTAHFDAPKKNNFKVEKLPYALNEKLPDDVKVLFAKQVDDNFHARKSVKKKTYLYKAYVSHFLSPIDRTRKMRIYPEPNLAAMKGAASLLIGEHNFSAFMSAGSQIKDTTRTIFEINIKKNQNDFTFEICGNGFLYNMVRIIVGTLIEIGQGRLSKTNISKALESGDRKFAGKTAQPQGLYLKNVKYE